MCVGGEQHNIPDDPRLLRADFLLQKGIIMLFKPLLAVCLIAGTVLLKDCNKGIETTISPSGIQKFYLDHDWVPLDIPDSKYAPGSIVQITKATGIVYVSNVKTCGVPDEALSVVTGTSPKLTYSRDADYGAKAVLSIKGVSIGPEWAKVKNTSLEHDDHGADAIDILKLQIWLTDPNNQSKIPKACTDFLNAPDSYIVRESYRVSKGKYTLHGENGAQLKITALQLGPVKIDPDAHAKVTEDGSLEFTEAVYTAIKRLRDTNGLLQPLAPGAKSEDADQKVKAMLYPQK